MDITTACDGGHNGKVLKAKASAATAGSHRFRHAQYERRPRDMSVQL